MSITFVSSTISSATEVATACVVIYPASIAAGDGLVLIVGTKPFSSTITTPAGFTALGEITNGSTASSADLGSVKAAAFFKTAVGGETGNLTVSVSGADSTYACLLRYTKAANVDWQTGFASGTDASAGTTWSVAFSSNPGITTGDNFVLGGVTPTDIASTWSALALASTSATISAGTQRQSPRISTGNDLGGSVTTTLCTAGTGSTSPTWTATLSVGTNEAGSAVLVRLREVTRAVRVGAPYMVRREAIRRQNRW